MSRLIFLFAIVAVVYLLFKSWRSKASEKQPEVVEDMVRCAHCGVHLPMGESVRSGDQFFCCADHLDAHQK